MQWRCCSTQTRTAFSSSPQHTGTCMHACSMPYLYRDTSRPTLTCMHAAERWQRSSQWACTWSRWSRTPTLSVRLLSSRSLKTGTRSMYCLFLDLLCCRSFFFFSPFFCMHACKPVFSLTAAQPGKRRPRVLYTVPTGSNPSGTTTSLDRRSSPLTFFCVCVFLSNFIHALYSLRPSPFAHCVL